MHHVDFGSKTCKIRLLSSLGLPELTDEEIAMGRQQDRLDYAGTKAQGVWRNAGPPACPPSGGWTRPKHSSCRDVAASSDGWAVLLGSRRSLFHVYFVWHLFTLAHRSLVVFALSSSLWFSSSAATIV